MTCYENWSSFMRYLEELENGYRQMMRSAESKEARCVREGQVSAIRSLRKHLESEDTVLGWHGKTGKGKIARILETLKDKVKTGERGP